MSNSSVSSEVTSRIFSNCRIEQLLLDGNVEDYEYLNKSRREVDGVDDREEWKQLKVSHSVFPENLILNTSHPECHGSRGTDSNRTI